MILYIKYCITPISIIHTPSSSRTMAIIFELINLSA
jgi:hypothetical protein